MKSMLCLEVTFPETKWLEIGVVVMVFVVARGVMVVVELVLLSGARKGAAINGITVFPTLNRRNAAWASLLARALSRRKARKDTPEKVKIEMQSDIRTFI